MSYRFEWDDNKARSNIIDHGVSFDEASTVFDDSLARVLMTKNIQIGKGAKSLLDIL